MITINGTTNSPSHWTFALDVYENSTSVANNTSNVTVKVYIGRTSTAGGSYMYGCKINGTVGLTGQSNKTFTYQNNSQVNIDGGKWLLIGTVNFPSVPHNDDGTKTVTVTGSFTNNVSPSSGSASGSVKLTTIARASQPSLVTWPENTQNVGEFGDTIDIFMNRNSASFTHTVRYEFGSLTGTIATGVTNDCQWTIPLSFMDLLPANTSGSGRVYVDTYNGSTLIGTKYSGFTATVPASVKPAVSLSWVDESGAKTTYGNPVKGLSRLKITASATPAYSSPIASYSIDAGGVSYDTQVATTGLLSKSGNYVIKVSATDKRQRTNTANQTISVLDYSPPTITALSAIRCDENGVAYDRGEYIKVSLSAFISSLSGKNAGRYVLKWKKSSESTFPASQQKTYSGASVAQSFTIQADLNSYDIVFEAADNHTGNKPVTKTVKVSTTAAILSWRGFKQADGKYKKAVGIGKAPDRADSLQLGFELYDLYDTMISNGSALYTGGNENAIDPNTTLEHLVLTNHANAPKPIGGNGREYFYIQTVFYKTKASDRARAQMALPYSAEGLKPFFRYFFDGIWSEWEKLVTWDDTWPVGSIYFSFDHISPAQKFGGTWTRIENRFLWATTATGNIGATGGGRLDKLNLSAKSYGGITSAASHSYAGRIVVSSSGVENSLSAASPISSCGIETLPPYIQVSVWYRTE